MGWMNKKKKLTKRAPKKRTRIIKTDSGVSGEKNLQKWPIAHATRLNLRYNDYNKLTSSAGSVATQQWRMNSCYDVDYTYVGHQPYGWDQISPLYNFYCVIGFTIIIRYTAQTNPVRVVIEPRFNNISLATDPQAVMERNKTLNFIAVPELTGTKRFKINLPALAAQSLVNYKQTCGAVPAGNPTVITWLNMYVQTMDTATTGSLLFDYEIYQDTLLEQPVVQAQS